MDNSSIIKVEERNSLFVDYFSTNAWLIFLLLSMIGGVTMYLQQNYIISNELFYDSLGEQLTRERIDEMLNTQKEYLWFGYLMIPLVIIIQAFLITICLNIGTILFEIKTSFGQLFSTSIKALIVLAFGKLIIAGLLLVTDVNSISDITSANIFSLLGVLGQDQVPQWSWYPLGLVNLFEILFWPFLALGLSSTLNKTFKQSLKFILLTYGTGLLIWTLFVMSLQLGAF